MQSSYKMIGADGAEYGPVSLKELRGWIAEGRVVGSTQVRRETDEYWSTAASFSELAVADHVGAASGKPAVDSVEAAELEKRVKSGGSWLYWIAGLTLINSIAVLAGSNWSFVLGLTITQVIDALVVTLVPAEISLVAKGVAFVVDLVAMGLFVFLGVQACRKRTWAFAVGVTLYGLDTLLTLLSLSVVSIGIHGWALFCLIIGMKAARQWSKLGYANLTAAEQPESGVAPTSSVR
jgi:hypothetical protein